MHVFALLSLGCALCAIASPVETSMEIAVTRASSNATSKKNTGILAETLGRSLYWFGNFTVGDSQNVKLVIDTGSTDLILNPGVYKPSKHMSRFNGTQNFTTFYEGINRAGFGFETIEGTLRNDQVIGAGGLTVPNQTIGNITSYSYADIKPRPFALLPDGIIGFASSARSAFQPPQNSWFYNLCQYKILANCQFGLAYGTSGSGLAIIGKVAERLINGPLVSLPMIDESYIVKGDVTLDNKTVVTDQLFIMDEGTDNIQGPLGATKKIFKQLGYPSHVATGPNTFNPSVPVKILTGYFPCDKPPTLGFSFPAKSTLKKGEKSTIFNVSPLVWDVYNHGNNNCTSILGGTNAITNKTEHFAPWLLGQPFFAGRYTDFNIAAGTISFGDLKNPATVT